MSDGEHGVARESVLKLQRLLEEHARLFGDFILSSGIRSPYYFDSKPVTLSPDGRALIAEILDPIIRHKGAEAVGGLEIGAIPISDALNLPGFIVRDKRKGHGTKERIAAAYSIKGGEDDLRFGCKVAIVDDVVTTGESIERAIDAAKACGCEVVAVVALVTRPESGAAERLAEHYDYISIFECDKEGNLSLTAEAEQFIGSLVA